TFGRALAQATGVTMMRLADADILPFEFVPLADTVAKYIQELQKLAKEKRDAAEELSKEVDEGLPQALADSRQPFVAAKPDPAVPYFDFSPLENASAALTAAAKEYEVAYARFRERAERSRDPARLVEINRLLRTCERTLTRAEGLPRRPWFVHYIY